LLGNLCSIYIGFKSGKLLIRSLAKKSQTNNIPLWDATSILDSQKIWYSNLNGTIVGGDSGGPALFNRNNVYRIFGVGIHQRYDPCVKEKTCESQSAYSNTTFFANWIKNTLKK